MSVALSPPAAGRHDDSLACYFQVGQQLSCICFANHCTDGNFDHAVFTPAPMLVFAHAMLPATGLVQFLIPEVQQGCQLGISHSNDVTAIATVTAIRSTAGNKFFPPKADATPSTVASDDFDFDFVNKLHRLFNFSSFSFRGQKKSPERGFFIALATLSLRHYVDPFSLLVEAVKLEK